MGNGKIVKLLLNCFLGPEGRLSSCLVHSPATAEEGALQGQYQRLLHPGFGVPISSFELHLLCQREPSGNGSGGGI